MKHGGAADTRNTHTICETAGVESLAAVGLVFGVVTWHSGCRLWLFEGSGVGIVDGNGIAVVVGGDVADFIGPHPSTRGGAVNGVFCSQIGCKLGQ